MKNLNFPWNSWQFFQNNSNFKTFFFLPKELFAKYEALKKNTEEDKAVDNVEEVSLSNPSLITHSALTLIGMSSENKKNAHL